MGRFAVGDTAVIRNEGIHGFKEGTHGVITEVGAPSEDGEDSVAYKVDTEEQGRRRSRYIDGKDLRVPEPAVPNPLSKEAREQPTIVKAKALQRVLDRDKDQKGKDQKRIAKAKGSRAIARSRNPKAEASAGTGTPSKASPKPSEPEKPSSPKLRPLKVHAQPKTAKVLATVKKKADPKPKGTKGKPKPVAKT